MPQKHRTQKLVYRLVQHRRPSQLKAEIFGLLLLAMGLFLLLCMVSYHPDDPVTLVAARNSMNVHNWMGIIGAIVADRLFVWTFGYGALAFPLIVLAAGVVIMFRWQWQRWLRFTALALLWGWWLGALLALPAAMQQHGLVTAYYPSGFLSALPVNQAIIYMGPVATVLVMLSMLAILIMITFRLSLVAMLNGVAAGIHDILTDAVQLFREIRLPFSRKEIRKESVSVQKSGRQRNVGMRKPQPSEKRVEEREPEVEAGETETPAPMPEIITSQELEANHHHNNDVPLPTREIVLEEEEKLIKEDIEIEAAVQEKELDYDAIIQNTLKHYQFPSIELLDESDQEVRVPREELMENAALLERTLQHFGVKATVKRVVEGPVITLYAVKPAEGVKISQIVRLADDLSLAMRAKGIRMIAPIPGEAAIGIEVPNRRPSTVHFKSIVRSEKFIQAEGQLILGLGKTISGEVFCADLARMPHLLIAGATGAGKSVGINTMIASLLYRVPPSDLKFVLIDPKKLELSLYAKLKDHYLATVPELDEIVITHPQNAILVLRSVVNEMEARYDKLAQMGVRDIVAYNQKISKLRQQGEHSNQFRRLPYLVVIIDELADLILTAQKEVEEPIIRLAQMARAVGIHLIVATQRPSYDILTGLIKANFPARISYHVATRHDSKVILDMYGAEKLIGNGDMLFMPPGIGKPIRLQNPYLSTEEVERIIRHIRKQPKFPPYELKLVRARTKVGPGAAAALDRDELFEKAKEIVIRYQQGSISLLQRKLKIGYARAARLIDELEEEGIVGPGQGSKARDVLVSTLENDMQKGDDES